MTIKNIILPLAALAGFMACTGCSTVINGTTQSLSVQTTPENGANCALTNDKGQWYVSSTPGSVVVHRSNNPLTVQCQKNGYKTTNQAVKSYAKGMLAGNIIAGGVVGAGVDLADGAAFGYPPVITVPMEKGTSAKMSSSKHHHKKHHS